jgi:hypothetical protein
MELYAFTTNFSDAMFLGKRAGAAKSANRLWFAQCDDSTGDIARCRRSITDDHTHRPV